MGESFPPGWFVVAASILVVGWLLFELWLRTAPSTEVEVTDRREGGSEGSSYQAQVLIPSRHGIEQKWVWVSHSQFQILEKSPVMSVQLRQFGERTFVRSGRHRSLVWLLAFISIYLVSELISQVFDS